MSLELNVIIFVSAYRFGWNMSEFAVCLKNALILKRCSTPGSVRLRDLVLARTRNPQDPGHCLVFPTSISFSFLVRGG